MHEHENTKVMTSHALPALLQQLATDPGIHFAMLVPQHSRLIVPMRIRHPLHSRSLAKW